LDAPLRTDPKTFAVRGVGLLGQLIIPLALVFGSSVGDGEAGEFAIYILPLALIFVGLSLLFTYISWMRLTYRVGEADIRIESGVISRAARSVPYERIQDVSMEQKLLPRLFGLVSIKFETGAGGEDELALAYLSEAEGERLRELVRVRKSGIAAAGGETDPLAQADGASAISAIEADNGPPIFAMSPKRVVLFGVYEFSLTVMAVLAGMVQQFDFLFPFDIWDPEGWEARLAGPGAWLAGLGPLPQIVGGLGVLIGLAVLGTAAGLVRTVLRDWGFVLDRTEKGFRRRRGLFTRTDVVMPAHRVQALKFSTGILRRLSGWHGLKFVSLAQDSGGSSHDVAPFARWEELEPIAASAGFLSPHEGLEWRKAAQNYRFDAIVLNLFNLVPLVLIAVGIDYALQLFFPDTSYAGPLTGLVLIAALILVLGPFIDWRFRRHAIDEAQIYARAGWLAPRTDVASRIKLQSVEIAQGPIAARRGYASLKLGLAGGNMEIAGLPLARAHDLRDAILASIGSRDFSQLV
jgi:putative membrane protein